MILLGHFSQSFDVIRDLPVGYIVTCSQVVVGMTYLFIFTFCLLFSRSSLVNDDWTVPHTYLPRLSSINSAEKWRFLLGQTEDCRLIFICCYWLWNVFFLYGAVIYWLVVIVILH